MDLNSNIIDRKRRCLAIIEQYKTTYKSRIESTNSNDSISNPRTVSPRHTIRHKKSGCIPLIWMRKDVMNQTDV